MTFMNALVVERNEGGVNIPSENAQVTQSPEIPGKPKSNRVYRLADIEMKQGVL